MLPGCLVKTGLCRAPLSVGWYTHQTDCHWSVCKTKTTLSSRTAPQIGYTWQFELPVMTLWNRDTVNVVWLNYSRWIRSNTASFVAFLMVRGYAARLVLNKCKKSLYFLLLYQPAFIIHIYLTSDSRIMCPHWGVIMRLEHFVVNDTTELSVNPLWQTLTQWAFCACYQWSLAGRTENKLSIIPLWKTH